MPSRAASWVAPALLFPCYCRQDLFLSSSPPSQKAKSKVGYRAGTLCSHRGRSCPYCNQSMYVVRRNAFFPLAPVTIHTTWKGTYDVVCRRRPLSPKHFPHQNTTATTTVQSLGGQQGAKPRGDKPKGNSRNRWPCLAFPREHLCTCGTFQLSISLVYKASQKLLVCMILQPR